MFCGDTHKFHCKQNLSKSWTLIFCFSCCYTNLINFYNHPELWSSAKNDHGWPKCRLQVKLVKTTKSRLYLGIPVRSRPNLIEEIENSRPFYFRNNAAPRMTLLACADSARQQQRRCFKRAGRRRSPPGAWKSCMICKVYFPYRVSRSRNNNVCDLTSYACESRLAWEHDAYTRT